MTLIFVLQGFLIGVVGSGVGTLLGWLVITFRNDIMHKVSEWTHMELFPKELYFFNELPAHIVPGRCRIHRDFVGAAVHVRSIASGEPGSPA